ncbi:alanine racemase [Parvicella tangerina]|uniref:Alanine racemase n=1 Tax=Parvicella tangerina TaxID=2829795 RepID=A0A916JND3_9FLAO|nr:alanine racemase [Parvicella tangerina]CAG5080658.1 Alanine racemase 1 [Parvicella tangerina]
MINYTSFIEISRKALKNNIHFINSQMNEGVTLSAVVKADAYGHGISCFVPIAEEAGVRHFSVFSADEAMKVLGVARSNPTIMIMGMIENSELNWAIQNDIEFFVFEETRVKEALKAAKELGKPAKVHLEVETGLNRTGFTKKELSNIIDDLKHPLIEVKGFCTHLGGAESIANHYRIQKQKKKYSQLYKWLVVKGVTPEKRHMACSAALIRYPETQFDMVRVGILQYGFWPNTETFIHYSAKNKTPDSPLERVISWKTKVMSVKKVKTGEFISYGTSFLADRDMVIAAVPVGYSHGYARSLSNTGRMLIHGVRTAVVGLVNMNMMLIDVTDIPNVKKGDEVVLIGTQGEHEVSVASFGEMSNQLNYELLTRLPYEIPRRVVD